ncbi:hypothetical protein [Marinomonas foliarum]|uniref:Virion membrane fusion protein p10 n=1 Tax=Marinomonas foliarum TaxID=491950 RepID=A0A369AFB1_9GAMM|nr:hypothetical protein [Marinomonas foliarum]RCX07048.1 virion membrane fusion protein p10 [Marinomonas foliarum]
MSLWDDISNGASSIYNSAADSVSDAAEGVYGLFDVEDSENAPQTYQQTASLEQSATGETVSQIPDAQNNTGAQVTTTAQTNYTPYFIGGGVLIVVLLFLALMMRRK